MSETSPYQVLLYYQYVTIADPVEFARNHAEFCHNLELLGRILVAAEGINGTVSGTTAACEAYMRAMHADLRFKSMQFKVDPVEGHTFRKLKVKPRQELVTFRDGLGLDPRQKTGRRLSPREFHDTMLRDDVVIVDARNSYEYDIGHFRRAIRPEVKTTREFPEWIRENLAAYKDKTVLTYCTGGIRCEKFSALLLEEGFSDVAQLHGGIVTYGKDPEVQGRLFDGKCYVFDERACVEVNRTSEATVVGRCFHCDRPSERFVNCANTDCDNQYICCVDCEFDQRRSCSATCQSAKRHEFDPATAGGNKSFYR